VDPPAEDDAVSATQRIDYRGVAPAGVKTLDSVHGYVMKCGLPRRLIELAFLRISQINGCAYCIGEHSRELLEAGMPIEHLVLVPTWREAGVLFGEQERAALGWAEAVTRLGEHGVSEEDFRAAAAAFDEKPLVDLTIAISLMNAYNRLSIAFRTTPASSRAP
jgi:AhpD family alkylhydroperoxidase